MIKNIKIVLVGGGSVDWSPTLINDLMLTPELQDARYTILDIDAQAGCEMVEYGQMLAAKRNLCCTFDYTASQKEAFTGADFIIITISTGDLDAMEYDIKIPEDYRIYQTVGDTVGPGGWARGLRNIHVFAEMAKSIEKYAPGAVVLNYTNPMSTLTKVFYKVSNLKTVGLCHGLFEVYSDLMKIFSLDSEEDLKVRFGGINHFFWITDLKIKGEDGYEMLRKKMDRKTYADLAKDIQGADGAGFDSLRYICSELFDFYGYLPYVSDRHTCEFLPGYLTGDLNKIEKYELKRTTIEERRKNKAEGRELIKKYLSGAEAVTDKRSRETAADIIAAFVNDKDFIDVVNLPNEGQIANLPEGSIVETLGVVNSSGFTPITAGKLPEPILNLVLPHVRNQDMIVDAGLTGDVDLALYALYNDPLCSQLTLPEIKEMGMKLLKAHKKYLPQFKGI